jgi:hypothetical protein
VRARALGVRGRCVRRASCGSRAPCVARRRLAVGVAVVAALFGLVGASKVVGGLVAPVSQQLAAVTSPTVGYEAVIAGESDCYETAAAERSDAFAAELVSLSGRECARLDEGSRIVGWSCEGEVADAQEHLRDELSAKGWKAVDAGQEGCESFTKADGEYRWAFASFAQVGNSVSVVLQFA